MVEQDDEAHYAKLVTRVVAGCDHMFKCLRMFRRTENIMEIQVGVTMMVVVVITMMVMMMMMLMMVLQEGSPTTYQVAACSPQNFDERLMIYTTLFKVCSIFSVRSSSYFYGFDNCNGLLTR